MLRRQVEMRRYPGARFGPRLLRAALVIALLATLLLKSGVAWEAKTITTFPVAVQTPEEPPEAAPLAARLEAWDEGFGYITYQFGVLTEPCTADGGAASLQATGIYTSVQFVDQNAARHSVEGFYTGGAILLGTDAASAPSQRLHACVTRTALPGDIQWGAVHNLSLPTGETVLVTADPPQILEAQSEAPPENTMFFIRVWEPTTQQGVLVPLGESYRPTVQADAAFSVSQAAQDNLTCLAAGMVVAAGAATAWNSHRWKDWHLPVPWPLLGFFTRLRAPRLLEHRTRRLVHDVAEANPGIRFADLRDRTGLAVGVLTHHLKILEEHGLLRSVYRGRQRHVYPASAKAEGAALTDTQRAVLRLAQQTVITQAEIARRLGISQQAVSYTLRRLRQLGILGNASDGSTDAAASEATGAGVRPLFDPKVLLSRPNLRGALQL